MKDLERLKYLSEEIEEVFALISQASSPAVLVFASDLPHSSCLCSGDLPS